MAYKVSPWEKLFGGDLYRLRNFLRRLISILIALIPVKNWRREARAKIDQLYQNLSDKEKKVATMLRLGQTSKQIALQLNISAASVDNYRYTLRKKMNIPKGKSLKMFIQNI